MGKNNKYTIGHGEKDVNILVADPIFYKLSEE